MARSPLEAEIGGTRPGVVLKQMVPTLSASGGKFRAEPRFSTGGEEIQG